jgi:hypothetical protein
MTEYNIRYRRPETPYSLSRMTTQDATQAAAQVERLVALGYVVADVTPPLAQKAPKVPEAGDPRWTPAV